MHTPTATQKVSILNSNTWPEDIPIPLDHELVPELIREAAVAIISPGDTLHRVATDNGMVATRSSRKLGGSSLAGMKHEMRGTP